MTELSWSKVTRSARGTRSLARRIGREAAAGMVLALVGNLGAGKTTFVQGLAEGLGVDMLDEVLSPTYTLVNEYPATSFPLVHLDFYRLEGASAARALGLEEQIHRRDAVVAVEWADRCPELLPAGAAWIRLGDDEGNARTIRFEGLPQPPKR